MKLKKAAVWLLACLFVSAMPFGVACGGSGADNGESSSVAGGGLNETSSNGGTSSSGGGSSSDISVGDKVKFGSYPQTQVTSESVISALNGQAGALPTAENSQGWTSYGYYKESSTEFDFMWYQDVTYGEEKYRGVYFSEYRPRTCEAGNTMLVQKYSYQGDNGYNPETVYWFAFEKLEWTVLEQKDGKTLLHCSSIIDGQEYYNSTRSRDVNGAYATPNNYAESNIRKWLNASFYETAFTAAEQGKIATTLVDNSVASTAVYDGVNQYACENTNDKVFLLSKAEATNTAYGFSESAWDYGEGNTRIRKPSDYAKCQGVGASAEDSPYGSGWWLRSPVPTNHRPVMRVSGDGDASGETWAIQVDIGVAPAMWITL